MKSTKIQVAKFKKPIIYEHDQEKIISDLYWSSLAKRLFWAFWHIHGEIWVPGNAVLLLFSAYVLPTTFTVSRIDHSYVIGKKIVVLLLPIEDILMFIF